VATKAVVVKRSPQGAVVIVRGFGFVTASALMTNEAAERLARECEADRRVRK